MPVGLARNLMMIGRVIARVGIVALLSAWPLTAQVEVPPQAKAYATAPEIPYESVREFFKLPRGLSFGSGMGAARNSSLEIFAFHRSGESSRLFQFTSDGAFMREIGGGADGFRFAHAVRIDREDNIWVVDEGTNLITKFSPDGQVLMTLGRPDAAAADRFARPTDIAWDRQGNIFISDGHTNARVVKFDKDGRFVKSIGGARGSAPGQFDTPHSIQVDTKGTVYVADQGNRRIQVLSNDLTVRQIYDHVGTPWNLCITPGPHQYLYSSNSAPDDGSQVRAGAGEIYLMELDGTVMGRFGRSGVGLGEFATTHAVECRDENELIIGEAVSARYQKIILYPNDRPRRPPPPK